MKKKMNTKGARGLVNAILIQAARDVIAKPTKSRPYERDKALVFLKSKWGRLLLENSAIKEYTQEQAINRLRSKMQ